MSTVIAVVGFVGGWLLVAGPIYQASVELAAETVDRAAFATAADAVPPPAPVSLWWWLLPPVFLLLQRRSTRTHRDAVLRQVTTEQAEQLLQFGAKATGWLVVALGASCIAIKETWELVEHLEWPLWSFGATLLLALVAAVLYAALRTQRDRRMLERRSGNPVGA